MRIMDIELISAVVVSYSKILHEMQEMKADIKSITMSMKNYLSTSANSSMESSQEPCIRIESQSDSIDMHNTSRSNEIIRNTTSNITSENNANTNNKDTGNATDALVDDHNGPCAWFFSEIEKEI
ncbi:hypothetical protein CWI42_120610 [Ordospora colligata]|uniref:Uncharacterized protein n=1 Tax=Ordospora colligata OC4 TaxID=1354746 RepID=A0A0B2UIH2_9MICR|nr:uncharacterized protein M896_120610 [Ordospora colligata OC4]KHN68842.1 hypothetical protein M896_120610 [Ordospora colligata OC4]TBU17734.1 hypothetical protein CWI42_120610 [Ordospora colligata]